MSNHPPSSHKAETSDTKSATVKIKMDPTPKEGHSDDDIEDFHESSRDHFFGYLKWFLFLAGIGSILYFGGGILKGYWLSDYEQKIMAKDREIQLLKETSSNQSEAISFEAVIKQVTSSPRGKAYLATDRMGQPWFAISGSEFKVADKVLLVLKFDSTDNSVQVSVKKSENSEPSPVDKPMVETHSKDHTNNTPETHNHDAPKEEHHH